MPLPGTVVIPSGWSAHHRPVATGGQTATCSLRRPGGTGKSFNSTTGTTTDTPHTAYVTGAKCRVAELTPTVAARLFGEQQVTTGTLFVTVDWTTAGAATVQIDDVLTVTAVDDNGDPSLVGRPLRVDGIGRGSLEWERVLAVVDNEG